MNHWEYPHPSSNAEIYRNMTPGDRPPKPDKQLQFIAVHNGRLFFFATLYYYKITKCSSKKFIFTDETAIVGANNLTGRYWSGTVWWFSDCSSLDRNNASAASKTESSVADAGFLDNHRLVVGEDSGVLQILEVPQDANVWKSELKCTRYACQHDDSITSLAIFDNKTNFVTCGMDYW